MKVIYGAHEIAQRFFAELARDIRQPGYGDHARQTIEAILKRATEAGLYDPTRETT